MLLYTTITMSNGTINKLTGNSNAHNKLPICPICGGRVGKKGVDHTWTVYGVPPQEDTTMSGFIHNKCQQQKDLTYPMNAQAKRYKERQERDAADAKRYAELALKMKRDRHIQECTVTATDEMPKYALAKTKHDSLGGLLKMAQKNYRDFKLETFENMGLDEIETYGGCCGSDHEPTVNDCWLSTIEDAESERLKDLERMEAIHANRLRVVEARMNLSAFDKSTYVPIKNMFDVRVAELHRTSWDGN